MRNSSNLQKLVRLALDCPVEIILKGYEEPVVPPATDPASDPATDPAEGEKDEGEPGEKALKALKAERIRAKNLERELKALKAKHAGTGEGDGGEGDEDPNDETDKGLGKKKVVPAPKPPSDKATAARLAKLTEGFRRQELNNTLAKIGNDFRDPKDILAHIDISEITYTQDDDDPTQVIWDEVELKTVIKQLRKDKPYLLKDEVDPKAGPIKRPTGSKFAGVGKSADMKAGELADLQRRIPALRGIRPPTT